MRYVVMTVLTILLALTCTQAVATTKLYTQVTVQATLIQEGELSGCAVKTNLTKATMANDNLTCGNNWLVLDCDGSWGSKNVAQGKLGASQLAYVSGRKLNVVVDDSKKANGYCFASRVDNAP